MVVRELTTDCELLTLQIETLKAEWSDIFYYLFGGKVILTLGHCTKSDRQDSTVKTAQYDSKLWQYMKTDRG